MYFAAQETMYLRQLLSELGFRQHEPTLIRQDNTSAIKIAHGNVQDTKLKHMKIKYFAVREWIAHSELMVSHVASSEQWADIMTKSLDRVSFERLRSEFMTAEVTLTVRRK